jgi:hypothetical protein
VAVGLIAAKHPEEGVLDRLGDRAPRAAADGDAVDRVDRCDLDRGAEVEEALVDVTDIAQQHLAHRITHLAASVITEARVIPASTLLDSGGVTRAPLITRNRFWPLPSLTFPCTSSAIASL